jgi:hypothetical protein
MALTLAIGANPTINLADANLADLASYLESTPTSLSLGNQWVAALAGPISAIPNKSSCSLTYSSGNQTWQPGSGPLTFTLSGSVSGSITIYQQGPLLTYTDGFAVTMGSGLTTVNNSNTTKSLPETYPTPPGGISYVCISLQFQLAVGVGATYTSGLYGVSVNGSASSSLVVSFYKAVPSNTPLTNAITLAFQGFKLPLHPQTLTGFQVNDYLDYVFNAKLQLSVGASVSLPSYKYAGQGTQDIPGVADAVGGSASINLSVSPGIKATFSCDYGGTFEAVLWLDPNTPTNARLHIYRYKTQTQGLDVNATLGITGNTTQSVNVSTQAAIRAISGSLSTDPAIQTAVSNLLSGSKYVGQVNNWVTELNNKVGAWLKPINNLSALDSSIEATIQSTKTSYILTDYTIDLTANYAPAWEAMIEGRFYDALALTGGGVSLGVGSGLEAFYNRTASLKVNLFGNLNLAWSSGLIANAQLVYAGDGVFHLSTAVGRTLLTSVNKSNKEIDIYFAADVDLTVATAPINPANIQLHVVLQAANNKSFGGFLAAVASRLAVDSTSTALASAIAVSASQGNATQIVHLILGANAFGNLEASVAGSLPPADAEDRASYLQFQTVCGSLYGSQPIENFTYNGVALDYDIWGDNNIAATNAWPKPPGARPNRRAFGITTAGNVWQQLQDEVYADIPQSDAEMVSFTLVQAQLFMNLCEDLEQLVKQPMNIAAANWQNIVNAQEMIIKNDVPADYLAATGLALAHISGIAPTAISGPASNAPSGPSVALTFTYA